MLLALAIFSIFSSYAMDFSKVLKSPECQKIAPFYWELGDAAGVKFSGQVGGKYNSDSEVKLASASKLILAAYYHEKVSSPLLEDISLLKMTAGRADFKNLPCITRDTVEACFKARGNDGLVDKAKGRFAYSGAHSQALGVKLGLGSFNTDKLAQEFTAKLKLPVKFANVGLGGGMKMKVSDYSEFLRRLIRKEYRLINYLGADMVCTKCPLAFNSPVPVNWSYSHHHWVERDQRTIEAYSSAGAMGFYPWVSSDKKLYGIIAREKLAKEEGYNSAMCGRQLRAAFIKNQKSKIPITGS